MYKRQVLKLFMAVMAPMRCVDACSAWILEKTFPLLIGKLSEDLAMD